MATFQPDAGISNQKADFTRSSQGFKADVSAGTMLESVAGTIDQGIKAGASLFKEIIRDDITKSVDEIQNMFTGNGPTPGSGGDPKKPLPQDVVARGERLQALTDAYHSGRIASSHYWTLLDAEARSMRSKYAGHREEIDNIFQDLTGAVPANRLIAELKSESNKKDAAAQEYRHWEDKAFGSPEYAAAMAKGYKPTQAELKAWGSAWQYRKARTDVAMGELNYQEKATEVGQRKAVDSVSKLSGDIVDDVWRAGKVSTGVDFEKLHQQAQEYIKAGKPVPTELVKSLEGLATAADAEMTQRFTNWLNQPSVDDGTGRKIPLTQFLTPDSLKKVTENFQARKAMILAPVKSGDTGGMAFNERMIKLKDNSDLANLLDAEPVLSGMRAFEKAVGPQVAQTYFNQNGDGLKAMDEAAKRIIISKATRNTPIEADIREVRVQLQAAGKDYDEKAVTRSLVKDYVKTIQDPKTLPEGRTQTINKLFSTPDFYRAIDNQKDREALYSMLVNPQIVKDVLTHGTEQDKQKYSKWVDTVAGIRLGEPASVITKNVIEGDYGVGVKYDPSTFTFRVEASSAFKPDQNVMTLGNRNTANVQVQSAIDSLNNTLQGWVATARATGKTPQQINETIKNSMLALGGFDIYNIKRKPAAATPAKGMSSFEPRQPDPNAEPEQP